MRKGILCLSIILSILVTVPHALAADPPKTQGDYFAVLGIGSMLLRSSVTDYVNSSNVLQTTHLGAATPQFLAGVAYQFPFRPYHWHVQPGCTCNFDLDTTDPRGNQIYCYPLRAFVTVKFSPSASSTINGYTFGLSHRLTKSLDFLVGFSFAPVDEPSPGFVKVAANVVTQQKGNPNYATFDAEAMLTSKPNAFDGFPTQLISWDPKTNISTVGPLIYAGNPLVTHYRGGLLLGIAVPISLKSLFTQ